MENVTLILINTENNYHLALQHYRAFHSLSHCCGVTVILPFDSVEIGSVL